MELIDKEKNQHTNYSSLRNNGLIPGYKKNKSIIFDKEMNVVKYKTLIKLDDFNNTGTKSPGAKINLMIEYINFIDIFFENSLNSILLIDYDAKIQYVNPRFEEATGYTLKEIKGRSFNILKCWDFENSQHDEFWETLNEGREWHGELKKKKKNGEMFWDYSTIIPVFNESQRITHYLIINEDITEIKNAENRLKYNLKNGFEDYSLRAKFLKIVSHEIKVNLNIISEFVEILTQFVKEDEYKYCNIYFDSVTKHINRLFNRVEDFSKEDPSQFYPLQHNNLFRILQEIRVPVKVIFHLIDLIKKEFGKKYNPHFSEMINVVSSLCERVLEIVRTANDLSKGETDEEKYLNNVLEKILEMNK